MDGAIMRTLRPPDHEHKEPDYEVIVNIVFLRELVHSLNPMLYVLCSRTVEVGLESGPSFYCLGNNCTLTDSLYR